MNPRRHWPRHRKTLTKKARQNTFQHRTRGATESEAGELSDFATIELNAACPSEHLPHHHHFGRVEIFAIENRSPRKRNAFGPNGVNNLQTGQSRTRNPTGLPPTFGTSLVTTHARIIFEEDKLDFETLSKRRLLLEAFARKIFL